MALKNKYYIREEYFEYLCNSVMSWDRPKSDMLLRKLHSINFFYTIRNDENREIDGLNLRLDFCDYKGYSYSVAEHELAGKCSVLEMLVALAKRCEDQIMWDPDKGDRRHVWFWKFIDNLGLGDETDDNWNTESDEKIEYYIGNWLSRNYFRDGFNGLFPLKHAKKDQRKVEIWYQLQSWIMENYQF